jgi:hypothetical protein
VLRDLALMAFTEQVAGLKKMSGFAAKKVEAFQQGC